MIEELYEYDKEANRYVCKLCGVRRRYIIDIHRHIKIKHEDELIRRVQADYRTRREAECQQKI